EPARSDKRHAESEGYAAEYRADVGKVGGQIEAGAEVDVAGEVERLCERKRDRAGENPRAQPCVVAGIPMAFERRQRAEVASPRNETQEEACEQAGRGQEPGRCSNVHRFLPQPKGCFLMGRSCGVLGWSVPD